ncbi:hypothetical protein SAMN04487830_13817 [Pseudobutyrivibrio sp. OR37]|nr:hypothetical protein SAMN04487830_13817 [Pseudobutyrivibrio sp. OR37]
MYLYHYYDKRSGPFRSVTAIPMEQGNLILEQMKQERPESMCAKRDSDYIIKRQDCENILRREFIAKGGIIEIESPYYMVVEHSPWLSTWYERGDFLKIPIEDFDVRKLSFTYGDSMPTFSPLVNDGKEYRKQVYTYEEILGIIKKYGLPQNWNDDGSQGPERYIEAHVWTNEPIASYIGI